MDSIERLDEIIAEARAAKACYRKLARLHEGQITRMHTGAMSRARTTTYNANAAWAAEEMRDHERRLRDLIGLPASLTAAPAPPPNSSAAGAAATSNVRST